MISEVFAQLATDLPTITAEINAYKRVAGEAVFEIGRRLKDVRDRPESYGLSGYRDWERWCESQIDMTRRSANRFIQAFEELGTTSSQLTSGKIFEIIQLPSDVDRSDFVSRSHTIPSTGATKTVEEMTVRELREVKAALKAEREARESQVRTVTIAGEPWFVAADVCKAIEIETTAVRRLDEDEKNTLRLTQGNTRGNPNQTVVNEPGLYALILGSRKPKAHAFKRWITHEVIPSILSQRHVCDRHASGRSGSLLKIASRLMRRTMREGLRRSRITQKCGPPVLSSFGASPTHKKAFYGVVQPLITGEDRNFIYVEPRIKARVKMRGWTRTGMLRTPVFTDFIV